MGLKELWVCHPEHRAADWGNWRRIVQGGKRPCLSEIEQQVATDLEGLRDKFPEWKRPIVTALEDREILMKEFGG